MQLPALKFPTSIEKMSIKTVSVSEGKGFSLTSLLLKWLANCPSIRNKIGAGFALVVGVAMLGTTMGFAIESHYEKRAMENLLRATQEADRMAKLRTTLLNLHLHEHQIVSLDLNSKEFKQQYEQLRSELVQLNNLLAQNQSYLKSLNSNSVRSRELATHKQLRQFMAEEQKTIAVYSKEVQGILQQISPTEITSKQVKNAQQKFKIFINSEVASEFDRVSEKVLKLADTFSTERYHAERSLDKADRLCTLILLGSLLASVAIATLVAAWISKAIAQPLESTTTFAQRVTLTSNFKLEAPVTTNDEVGRLTTSLNKMIQRVASYTEELYQTQAQLVQSEKMSSLGIMVAGIAHEVNNPVNFIHGNLQHVHNDVEELLALVQLYQKQYPNPPIQIKEQAEAIDFDFLAEDLPKSLASMRVGTERIRQLVLSLRNFSRLDEAEIKQIDLHEGIDSTLLILNHRFTNKIEVIKQYTNFPAIECYPAQLNQVFMNITSNAIDALLTDTLRLRKQIKIKTQRLNSDWVQVRIQDNGPGIPPEIQKKIFDPFFTTKPVGKGTGLGLSIAYQAIEKHHGSIQVISQLGHGTEFIITLPIAQPHYHTVAAG